MHVLADLSISLLYSSKSGPFNELPILLSWAIIIGGCYGVIRLILDVIRLVRRAARVQEASDRARRDKDSGGERG